MSSLYYIELIGGGAKEGREVSCNSTANTSALKAEELGKPEQSAIGVLD